MCAQVKRPGPSIAWRETEVTIVGEVPHGDEVRDWRQTHCMSATGRPGHHARLWVRRPIVFIGRDGRSREADCVRQRSLGCVHRRSRASGDGLRLSPERDGSIRKTWVRIMPSEYPGVASQQQLASVSKRAYVRATMIPVCGALLCAGDADGASESPEAMATVWKAGGPSLSGKQDPVNGRTSEDDNAKPRIMRK